MEAIRGMLLSLFWIAWLTSNWLTVRSGKVGVGVKVGVGEAVGVGVRVGVGVQVAVGVTVGVDVGVQVPMLGGTWVTTSSCATSSAVA